MAKKTIFNPHEKILFCALVMVNTIIIVLVIRAQFW